MSNKITKNKPIEPSVTPSFSWKYALGIAGTVAAVVGAIFLFAGGAYKASQMGYQPTSEASSATMISRTQIPASTHQVQTQFTPFPFLKSPFAQKVCDYFEGEAVCVKVTRDNAKQFLTVLDYLKKEGGNIDPSLRKKGNQILNGRRKSICLNRNHLKTPFPYESRLQQPGIYLVAGGTYGYQPDAKLKNHDKHLHNIARISKEIARNPDLRSQIESYGNSDKGVSLIAEETRALANMNRRKLTNHPKALEYFKNQSQHFDSQPNEDTQRVLLETHRILLEGVENHGGTYRNQEMIVFQDTEEDWDRSIEGLTALIKKRGGSAKAKIFKQLIQRAKNQQKDFLDIATQEERGVVGIAGYVPPRPQEIQKQMNQYIRDLRRMWNQIDSCDGFDPIDFAAFAHQQLGRIHPFADGNGRMARLVMNTILRRAGYQPVVFTSDEEYTAAINQDVSHPGAFANYLREQTRWVEQELDQNEHQIT